MDPMNVKILFITIVLTAYFQDGRASLNSGCYIVDDESFQNWSTEIDVITLNSGSECRRRCYQKGFQYAGTFIIECACGNSRPQKEVLKSKCNYTCPGNNNEYCGGGNVDVGIGFSVYEPSDVTPSHSAGFIGCFGYDEALDQWTVGFENITFNSGSECRRQCYKRGFIYAGTWIKLCACGNTSLQNQVSESECNNICPGNRNEYCGGNEQGSIYRTADKAIKRTESVSNKWVTPGAGRPVYFIRNAKMDHGSCNDFCNLLTPKSQVAVLDKDAELWLEKNKLIEASENYWINKTSQLQNECYYITGANKQRETHCHGYQRSCREATFTSRVRTASSCSLKYRCICQRRV
ncbi:sialate:O-sulfotransferase 1-like [Ruditapes philippinarum]|uniref:sialate:O-sulfotransferase 1-like n=1 Tax=Ruditapes philippinarum TaxID=129788 RepID=UPI00295ADD8D|nr:sialate:O-sulfotransferase 1-like [Ruditapes philippinarum]